MLHECIDVTSHLAKWLCRDDLVALRHVCRAYHAAVERNIAEVLLPAVVRLFQADGDFAFASATVRQHERLQVEAQCAEENVTFSESAWHAHQQALDFPLSSHYSLLKEWNPAVFGFQFPLEAAKFVVLLLPYTVLADAMARVALTGANEEDEYEHYCRVSNQQRKGNSSNKHSHHSPQTDHSRSWLGVSLPSSCALTVVLSSYLARQHKGANSSSVCDQSEVASGLFKLTTRNAPRLPDGPEELAFLHVLSHDTLFVNQPIPPSSSGHMPRALLRQATQHGRCFGACSPAAHSAEEQLAPDLGDVPMEEEFWQAKRYAPQFQSSSDEPSTTVTLQPQFVTGQQQQDAFPEEFHRQEEEVLYLSEASYYDPPTERPAAQHYTLLQSPHQDISEIEDMVGEEAFGEDLPWVQGGEPGGLKTVRLLNWNPFNSLQSLSRWFGNCPLTNIDLSGSNLSECTLFSYHFGRWRSTLVHLNLSNTSLRALPPSFVKCMQALRTLTLTGLDRVVSIGENCVELNPELLRVDCSGMSALLKTGKRAFSSNHKLVYLNCREWESFTVGLLKEELFVTDCPRLRWLDLSVTRLFGRSTVSERAFYDLFWWLDISPEQSHHLVLPGQQPDANSSPVVSYFPKLILHASGFFSCVVDYRCDMSGGREFVEVWLSSKREGVSYA